jgi:hypothetical protein
MRIYSKQRYSSAGGVARDDLGSPTRTGVSRLKQTAAQQQPVESHICGHRCHCNPRRNQGGERQSSAAAARWKDFMSGRAVMRAAVDCNASFGRDARPADRGRAADLYAHR